MSEIKAEGFDIIPNRRPDFRRPFSDGSMAIATSELTASLDTHTPFMTTPYYDPIPFAQPFFSSLPEVPAPKIQRGRSGRKLSMNDLKPTMRAKGANRAMSFSHTEGGRFGLGLETHIEGERTDSVSPPDYPFGGVRGWEGSLPSMQSFGTTVDDAILDSPVSPASQLAPMQETDELYKKQRRRECHNQVEKRRREHINAKIEELSHLLPPHYQQTEDVEEEEEDETSPKKRKPRRNSMAKKDLGPCKGRVLTHSVQYIHDLRRVNDIQATRIQQLEAILAGTSNNNFNASSQVFPLQPLPASPDTAEPFTQNGWYNPSFDPSPDAFRSSSSSSEVKPLPRVRTNSDMDIQVGMHGMDLESVFAGRRDGW